MSLKGIWKIDSKYDGVGEVVQEFDNRTVFTTVTSEYVEDDGRPFEEGEKVEILVRRIDRTQTPEEVSNRRDASDF